MSGVSIDQARPPSQTDIDMALAYEGGGNFMSRLTQLSDLKQRHDEALAELNLGQTAKAALADAQAKQTNAASQLDEVNRTLQQAEQAAAETVQKARADAAAILESANQAAGTMTNEAAVLKSDAESYAKKKQKAADASLKNAQAIEADSEAAKGQLSAALAAAVAEKVAHADAKAKADALAARLQAKIDAFHAAVDEARAS